MTRTVIALYENFADASATLRDLVDNGFSRDDISMMASNASGDYDNVTGSTSSTIPSGEESAAAEGAGVGAGVGAAIGGLGGLLIGLGALAIPGIGPVIAAGPLAAALTGLAGAGVGAVAGGVTGGLLGALVDMGVPEETAQYYAEGVRRGAHLVSARVPDHLSDRAVDIMNAHNPMDVNERVAQWRESGWSGFDVNAGPFTDTRESWPQESQRQSTGMGSTGMGSTGIGSTGIGSTGIGSTNTGSFGVGSSATSENAYKDEETPYGTHPAPESEMGETPYGTGPNSDNIDMSSDYAFGDFDKYEDRFRTHFAGSTYAGSYTYEQYQPAYRYGYDLATDERYRDRNWMDLESEAYRHWEERNPGTWESFKSAVRHAWQEIKDTVS